MRRRNRKNKGHQSNVPSKRRHGGPYLVSIIVPVCDRPDETRLCFDALRACTPASTYELIVVDNGSSPDTAVYLEETGAKVVRFEENRGVATAWNAGIEVAKGRYLVFLHNDVIVSPGWLEVVLKPFDDRRVGCVSPSYTELRLRPDYPALARTVAALPPETVDKELVPFCFALTKNALHRVGFFDEAFSFGPYADLDFEFRLLDSGLRVVGVNNALVHHFGGRTALDFPEFYGKNDVLNWERLRAKWGLGNLDSITRSPEFAAHLNAMKSVTLPERVPSFLGGPRSSEEESGARIVACVSVFNDIDMLAGCFESLAGVDEIIVVDGAYADFPHESPFSTDGTLEWIKQRRKIDPRIRLIECERPWADEIEKRSAYFTGSEGDWYLQIDADERLVASAESISALKAYLKVTPFDCLMFDMSVSLQAEKERYVRLYRHQAGLRYEKTHYNVARDGKSVYFDAIMNGRAPLYPGISLQHLRKERSQERKIERLAYYEKMWEREAEAIKAEVIALFSEAGRTKEYLFFVDLYKAHMKMLDERTAERVALDPKYLPAGDSNDSAESIGVSLHHQVDEVEVT